MNAILQWLFTNSPPFIRPAVTWLLEGLRRIIAVTTGFWNWLGVSVGRWATGMRALRTTLSRYALAVAFGMLWLRNVFIPRIIADARNAAARIINSTIAWVVSKIDAGLNVLQRWARSAIDFVRGIIENLRTYAQYWIAKIVGTINDLLRALRHVLSGPDVLAEWLIGSVIRAAGRYARNQADRIAQWLLRESSAFTLWLAREIETILLRWL